MRVLVLCDGGGSLGVGHVMRSLALAEAAVAAGHDVVVAGHFEGAFLAGQLAGAPVEVVPLAVSVAVIEPWDLVELVGRLRPDVLHVDSYDTSDHLLELLAVDGVEEITGSTGTGGAGTGGVMTHAPVLSNMEDGTFGRRAADVVVDPTLGAELCPRQDDGSTWLLRGSRYTPVRQRVIDARRLHDPDIVGTLVGVPEGEAAHRVLVVMGGTDPVGLAPVAVGLLARTGLALDVTVIADDENAERARAAARTSPLSLKVLAPVDDLPALMTTQDLVVSAAGTSVWELCCLGVPLAVIWAVDNQREGYDRVVAAGAAVGLGGPELGGPDLGRSGPAGEKGSGPERMAVERALDLLRRALTDSRLRADLALAGREVVDGVGAWRVVRTWEMAQRHRQRVGRSSDRLVARPATMGDARLLWAWRNDPATRAGSRSSDQVPWDDHLRWVTASLGRADRRLLIVERAVGTAGGVESVGTVRWDLAGEGEWEVSITVAPERRGQSLARAVLSAAELALTEVTRSQVGQSEVTRTSGSAVTAYLAVVHCDNRASLALFEAGGYLPDLPPDPRGFMRFRKAARVP